MGGDDAASLRAWDGPTAALTAHTAGSICRRGRQPTPAAAAGAGNGEANQLGAIGCPAPWQTSAGHR